MFASLLCSDWLLIILLASGPVNIVLYIACFSRVLFIRWDGLCDGRNQKTNFKTGIAIVTLFYRYCEKRNCETVQKSTVLNY